MKLGILNNNIAVIFSENVGSSLKTDQIEAKISTIYSEKTPRTVIAKFPGQVSFFIPEVQISIMVANQMMIVSDQTVGDFSKKDILKFAQLIAGIAEIINKPAIAYGFNFLYELENSAFQNLATKIQAKFFKPDVQNQAPENSLSYALPTLVFPKDTAKITLKFETIAEAPTAEESNKMNMHANVHYNGNLPTIEVLDSQYKELEQYISTYANSIFSERTADPAL